MVDREAALAVWAVSMASAVRIGWLINLEILTLPPNRNPNTHLEVRVGEVLVETSKRIGCDHALVCASLITERSDIPGKW